MATLHRPCSAPHPFRRSVPNEKGAGSFPPPLPHFACCPQPRGLFPSGPDRRFPRVALSFAKISSTRLTTADARVTRQGNARRRWTVESEEGNQILGHTDLRPYRSQAIQISGPIRPSRKEVKIRGSALTEGRARA